MINFVFPGDVLFSHHLCGKFQAPGSEWMHLTRCLTDFELMVVTDGILYIADDKKEYAIQKDEYLLMPPNPHQHGYQPGSCSFYWLHFHCPAGYEIIEQEQIDFSAQKIYVPLTGRLNSLDRIIVMMKELQDCDKRYHNFPLNNSICTSILAELGCQNILYKKFAQSKQTTQLFNDIADYVQYHCSENISITAIADYFGYNPKYLSSLFKAQSGMTLKQYILHKKMESAKAELSDTNHSISQIAYNIGFSDAHNFSNAFKKLTGLSPSEYRESFGRRALFYS